MHWLQALDISLFRVINQSLSNPLFDRLMPWVSGNRLFVPLVVLAFAALIWRWRLKGLFCVLMVALAVGLGDGVVSKNLKAAVGRDRPWSTVPGTNLLVGKGNRTASMPSSHSVNWFAATMVLCCFNRRSLRIMLPLAMLVGFSRIYNGAHYPSDVLVGAILGAGEAAALVIGLTAAWRWLGRKWFPLWWAKCPSLLNPESGIQHPASADSADSHWLRLSYLLIVALTLFRWIYLASGTIELSEDEAYQWLWSKHLALSYYSKPLMIAVVQFLGTSLFGDTVLGVRFFSPLLAAIMGIALLRFFARQVSARAGFFLVLILNATPLAALGTLVMTVDPLSVFFWTAAMLSGWRAIQEDSRTADWLWVGLWMGLGFLSKYTALFQLLSWVVLFALWAPARKQLRRPGPYLALVVNALCLLPVIIWNAQNGWPTVRHVVVDNARLNEPWKPTLSYLLEFIGGEAALFNPIFFVGIIIAVVAFLKRRKEDALLAYLFSMGAPLFLVYLAWTLHSRVQLNWIAPAIIPLLCLMVVYWHRRWQQGARAFRWWLAGGLALGLSVVAVAHNTDVVEKLTGHPLPRGLDPMGRVRVWSDVVKVVGDARQQLLAEGKPVFIIGGHYGIAGLVAFNLPEARKHVKDDTFVYFLSSDHPKNQFYFWPGYAARHPGETSPRKGQNAIYVVELDNPKPAPETLKAEFESVTDLGMRELLFRGRVYRTIQLFECRNLR